MAAPFIVPSTATICLAVLSWRRDIASREASYVAGDVRRPGAELLDGLARGEDRHRRRPTRARGRDLLVLVARHRPPLLGGEGVESGAHSAGLLAPGSRGRCRRSRPPSAPRPWSRRRSPPRGAPASRASQSAIHQLRTLGVEPPPDPVKALHIPLTPRHVVGLGVAGVDDGVREQLHQRAHDRSRQVVVGGMPRRADHAEGVLEQGVAGEHEPAAGGRSVTTKDQHPGGGPAYSATRHARAARRTASTPARRAICCSRSPGGVSPPAASACCARPG